MLAHEPLELWHEPRVTAQLEIGLHPLLKSRDAELFEPRAFSLRERDLPELGERAGAIGAALAAAERRF